MSLTAITSPRERAPGRAIAWMIAGALLFASMGLFARQASSALDWSVVAACRAGIGGAIAVLVSAVRRTRVFPRSRRGIWARSLLGTVAMGCTFYALADPALSLGDTVALMNLTPILIAFLSPWLLGERGGRRLWFALPLSFAGVVLVLRPPVLFGDGGSAEAMLPAGVTLCGALSAALAMIALRRVSSDEPPDAIAAHFSIIATCFLTIIALVRMRPVTDVPWLPLIGSGIAAGLGQLAMTRAYSLDLAARVGPFGYVSVVASALLGATTLGERPPVIALWGMTCIVLAGAGLMMANAREARR